MSLKSKVSESIIVGHDCYNIEDVFVAQSTLHNLGTMRRFDYEGTGDWEEITKRLEAVLGQPTLMQEDKADKTGYYDYVTEDTFVRTYFSMKKKEREDNQIQVRGLTVDAGVWHMLKEIGDLVKVSPDTNSVFALMSGQGGLSLRSLGSIEHDLVEDNYYKDAIEGYNHVLECYASDDPCGRITLLQGPPGTGKSYMIRSLVTNVHSKFIVVGAHMIADLAGPAILPVILGVSNSEDKMPITFILEDADVALAHRKSGGVSSLSGLLNLGDGLLGEMLDIRIIATTNAELMNMDPAVTRPGRMCRHVSLRPFTAPDATKLYQSMTGNGTRLKKATTLAEIYRMAREDGWAPKTEGELSEGQYL